MIAVGSRGKRYSPRFQFQVVLEVLKGDREATEIACVQHPSGDRVALEAGVSGEGSGGIWQGYDSGTIREEDQGARAATGKERSGDCATEPVQQSVLYV